MNRAKSINQNISDKEKDPYEQFEYQLYAQLKHKGWCQSMAFTKGNSLLFTQFKTLIKVLCIHEGQMNQIQILSSHKTFLTTITVLQKFNSLISTSQEGQIHVWSMVPIAKPIIIKKFDAPSSLVSCLLYNESYDIIITGSNNIINFWKNPMKWLLIQSINDHSGAVWALSLNQNENKLISCGWDKTILITARQNNESWVVVQKIVVKDYGYRLCFLDDDYFLYQPQFTRSTVLFSISDNGCKVKQVKEISLVQNQKDCDAFFPMQFEKQKKIILNKFGNTIMVLKVIGKEQIQIVQFINFNSHHVFGRMSDDGEFLVIWDESSNKLQIRKLCNL
ncbi:unnamed protein product (macronuclear) [Paramecium tetraurelia]|uniref:Uncharacterized protein n=1 Tax=Paramecium tetraurelia TaxID=5888 RepID=A0EBW9_PARTE|nr:uncharacterized protein GSPATT00025521001 [Paramecium tetraurelia]CAK92786.1 unnamed protein product [Paramecium tetraurelia]|eukprot:XP_001460183.1 hypothetical protein (macronuclear) [Paramecium tetraurelia strain d4-2]